MLVKPEQVNPVQVTVPVPALMLLLFVEIYVVDKPEELIFKIGVWPAVVKRILVL